MRSGFTLVEILVITALAALMIVLGTGIFFLTNRFYESQTAQIFATTAAREIGDRISEYTRLAQNFTPSYVYDGTTYTTDSQTLILELQAVDSSDNFLAGVYDYVIFAQSPWISSELELIVDPGAGSARLPRRLRLTDKLVNLTFSYDNADLALARRAVYDFTVTDTTGRYPATQTLSGSGTLRNK